MQLEKAYDPQNEEDDMMEMEEERLRMREHVMKNVSLVYVTDGLLSLLLFSFLCFFFFFFLRDKVDLNKDRLVSLEEFLKSTEKREFNNPREWEVSPRQNTYTGPSLE